jgi:phosphotransferase system enzyme I (PtsI)
MREHPATRKSILLTGQAISPGLAMGQAFVYQDVLQYSEEPKSIERHQVEHEYTRIARATEQVVGELEQLAARMEQELDAEVAGIFRSHQLLLQDPTVTDELRRELGGGLINAEEAVKRVFRRTEERFRDTSSEMTRQRGEDVADIGRRVLNALSGVKAHALERMPRGSVLVARRLLPSDTVFLSRRSAVAVVVEVGGPGSHVAILTRELGIPAVAQIPNLLEQVPNRAALLVDGLKGEVTLQPDAETRGRFRRQIGGYRRSVQGYRRRAGRPARTRDGVLIEVLANVGNPEDADLAAANGADGIGLFRIEKLYLARRVMPSESELFEFLDRTLHPFQDRPVHVRLLDVGGDKNLPFLDLPGESNPFLGRRGVRLLLEYPDLIRAQLRAVLRLSRRRRIRLLVPMVTLSWELERVKELMREAAEATGQGAVPVEAMIEIPSAALSVGELVRHADGISIGSNDLTQYTMAAARENPLVVEYFLEDHPAVLRLIEIAVREAGGTPVCICGELAGRPEMLPVLLQAGIRSLSVAPPLVPMIKESVRQIRLAGED